MVARYFLFVLMATLSWISATLTICGNALPPFSLPTDGEAFRVSPTEMCFQGLDFTFCEVFQSLFGQVQSVKHGWSCPHTHTPGMKMKYEKEAGSVEAKRVAGRVCREKAGHGWKHFWRRKWTPCELTGSSLEGGQSSSSLSSPPIPQVLG